MTAINRNNENHVPTLNKPSRQSKLREAKDDRKGASDEDQLLMSPSKRPSLTSTSKRQRLQRPSSARALLEGGGVSSAKQTVINNDGFPISRAISATRRRSTANPVAQKQRPQEQSTQIVRGVKNHPLSIGDSEEMDNLDLDEKAANETLNAMFERSLKKVDLNDEDENDSFGGSTISSKEIPLDKKYPASAKRSQSYFSPTTPERRVLSLNGIGSFSEHSPLNKQKGEKQLSIAPFVRDITDQPPSAPLASPTKSDSRGLPKKKSAIKKSAADISSMKNAPIASPSKSGQSARAIQNDSSTDPKSSAINPCTDSPSKQRNASSPGRQRRSTSRTPQERRNSRSVSRGRHASLSKKLDASPYVAQGTSPSITRYASPSKIRDVAPSSRVVSQTKGPLASPAKTCHASSPKKRQTSTMEKIASVFRTPTKLFSSDSGKRSSSSIGTSDAGRSASRGRSSINNSQAAKKRSSSASPTKKQHSRSPKPKRNLSVDRMETPPALLQGQERRQMQQRRQQQVARSKSPRSPRKSPKSNSGMNLNLRQNIDRSEPSSFLQQERQRKQLDSGSSPRAGRKSLKSNTVRKPRRHQSLSGIETSPAAALEEILKQKQRKNDGRANSKSPKRPIQSEGGKPRRHNSLSGGVQTLASSEHGRNSANISRPIKRTGKAVRSNRPTSLLERRHTVACLANEIGSLDCDKLEDLQEPTRKGRHSERAGLGNGGTRDIQRGPDESLNSTARVVAGRAIIDLNQCLQSLDNEMEQSRPVIMKPSSSRRLLAANYTEENVSSQGLRSLNRKASSARQLNVGKEAWEQSRPSMNRNATSARQIHIEKDDWEQSRSTSMQSINNRAKSLEQSRPASLRSMNKRASSARQINIERDSWKEQRPASLRSVNKMTNSVRQIEAEVESDRWEQSRPPGAGRALGRRRFSESRPASLKYVAGELDAPKSSNEKEGSGRGRRRRIQKIEAFCSPRQVSRSLNGRGRSPISGGQSEGSKHLQTPASRRLRRSLLKQDLMQELVTLDPDISESGHASLLIDGSDHDVGLGDRHKQGDSTRESTNSVTAAMSQSGSTFDMDDFIESRLPRGDQTELVQKTLNRAVGGRSTKNLMQQ